MRRFIITGAPGAGKTAIIRQLELDGFSVVEEAATDVIAAAQARGTAQPWTHRSFIDEIAILQKDRQVRASCQSDRVQFHDRCAVCTAALAVWLGHPVSPFLAGELDRIKQEAIYQPRVFFIRNLGFVTPTEARRISFEDTVRFEKLHEQTYRSFGFELFSVEQGSLAERVNIIKGAIRAHTMIRPDFTGEWVLNRQASSLSQAASAMESGILRIDHRDPKCGFRMNMRAGGQSVEHAWESLSDGAEVAGGAVVSRLLCDGDTLLFEARSQISDESWTMSWRYQLLEQGRCLRAVEQFRGSGRDQDNIWIFHRS